MSSECTGTVNSTVNQHSSTKGIRRWILLIFLAFVAYMALTPPSNIPLRLLSAIPLKESHHSIPAAVMVIILWWNLNPVLRRRVYSPLVVGIIAWLIGISLEYVQLFIPYRGFGLDDLRFNIYGILAGMGVLVVCLILNFALSIVKDR